MSSPIVQLLLLALAGSAIPVQDLRWAPGRWATYRLQVGSTRAHYLRIALVKGGQDSEGNQAWLELELGTHPELRSPLARMRTPYAVETGGPRLRSILVAMGLDRPVEIEAELAREELEYQSNSHSSTPGELPLQGPKVRLRTHAGMVTARSITWQVKGKPVKRLWTSAELPLWGLARWEIPGLKRSIEIWSHGEGAVSTFVAAQTAPMIEAPADEARR